MRKFSLFLLLALAAIVPVYGQTFGEIVGEVKDSTGAVIPHANVTVTNTATNVSRSTESNEAGLYTVPSLVPGSYSVRVEAGGFRPAMIQNIQLQVQQTV